jgi:hypothetical protein
MVGLKRSMTLYTKFRGRLRGSHFAAQASSENTFVFRIGFPQDLRKTPRKTMKTSHIATGILTSAAALFLFVGEAAAHPPVPPLQPVLSPYPPRQPLPLPHDHTAYQHRHGSSLPTWLRVTAALVPDVVVVQRPVIAPYPPLAPVVAPVNCWQVLYRAETCQPWIPYQTFHNPDQALSYAQAIQTRGYHVRIVRN